jgi:hypothetical protein
VKSWDSEYWNLESNFNYIKEQYDDWIIKTPKNIDLYILKGKYDFRKTLVRPSDVKEEEDDDFFVGKNCNFCIRHSLYDVLYKKLGFDKEKCITFLSTIKKRFEQAKPFESKYEQQYIDYFITDINKGIKYFEKMKNTEMNLDTFAQYYDPDLSMELNYDEVQIHTKYRIKKYPFLTESTAELEADVLLFEIRNFNNFHSSIYYKL